MDDRQKAALLREVDRFLTAGRDLFPLKPGTKKPLERKWNEKEYSRRLLHGFVNRRGCNIGWKLGPYDLVIDVDPRHVNALESEKQLTERWGVNALSEICPTVNSGGADRGCHYYTKTPHAVKLKTVSSYFDGIDFRRFGHFVAIPGCIHPDTGRAYEWNLWGQQIPPVIPDWLYDILDPSSALNTPKRKTRDPNCPTPSNVLSLPEIESHLSRIPATKYQNYDDWLKMGMAIHAACEGDPDGCELFVNWSVSDPSYFDATEIARAKWASFADNENGITTATLVSAAMLEGGSPDAFPAVLAFEEPVVSAPSLKTVAEFKRDLMRGDKPTLPEAVAIAARHGAEHWDDLREAIHIAYGARLGTVDQARKEYDKKERREAVRRKREAKAKEKRRQKKQNKGSRLVADPAIDVIDHLLKKEFDGGKHLINAKNQQFYEFKGTHWEPVPENEIFQFVFDAAEEIQLHPENELKFRSSTLFESARKVLIAKTARRDDVFRLHESPPPVVNTKNAEVWINKDGTFDVRDHRAESYLLSCLNTEYIEGALCPVFDRTMGEIFAMNINPEAMVRHWFEFCGYVMQPHKNIPTWWMFQGDGSNGKTFCFNVFQNLLGSAVLPRAVEAFADNNGNNHALASLVGKLLIMDDDARVDAWLPESALKKLAESKLMEANPKRLNAFNFICCATPVMLINDWPRVRDFSWGLVRKGYILPFKRVFSPEEYDLKREPYVIENELPGVLNKALAGYNRLRARGQFAEPAECLAAKEEWLRAANPLIEYFGQGLTKTGNGTSVAMGDVYQGYLQWCHNYGGVRYPVAKNRFEISLKQMGYKTGDVEGQRVVLGASIPGSAADVFQ
jgi:P4 family phage/plasmid primase-like protien